MAKTNVLLPIKPKQERRSIPIVTAPQTDDALNTDARLQGKFDLKYSKIREIRKDPTVSLLRQILISPAFHTEWTISAKENAPSGAKELIEQVLHPHRLHLLQTSFLGCIDFGWMPYEKILVEKDGNLVYTHFKSLLHDYTEVMIYANTGRFAGFYNSPNDFFDISLNNVELNEKESLHVVLEREGDDWYGRSISEVLEDTYDKYDEVNKSASRYDTKVAGSHWVLSYPVGKTLYNNVETSNDEIADDILSRLEANGKVAIPDEIAEYLDDNMNKEMRGKWRVELLSDNSGVQRSFIDRLKYLDNLKARAFHLPERSVLEGSFGTKAEAETHADIGLGTIDMKHRIIVHHYNQQIVNELLRLNFGEGTEDTVKIIVAPLVDSRLSIIREVYRLFLQNPVSLIEELGHIDGKALRQELNIPSLTDTEAEKKIQDVLDRNAQQQDNVANQTIEQEEKSVESQEG